MITPIDLRRIFAQFERAQNVSDNDRGARKGKPSRLDSRKGLRVICGANGSPTEEKPSREDSQAFQGFDRSRSVIR